MEVLRINKTIRPGEKLNCYFLGDIHEGNINHAEKELMEAIEIIRRDDTAIVVLMGDYIEAITPDDVNRWNPIAVAEKYGLRDLKDLPYRQIEEVYKKLGPISDKVVAVIVGNHEESYMKRHYSDIYKRFVEMFPSNPMRMGGAGLIDLSVGDGKRDRGFKSFNIAVMHGIGGGGYLPGYPINRVHQTFRWSDADVNIQGHLHSLVMDEVRKISSFNGRKRSRNVLYGCSGCFLHTYVEGNANYYEIKAGLRETDIGMLKIEITPAAKHTYNLVGTKIRLG